MRKLTNLMKSVLGASLIVGSLTFTGCGGAVSTGSPAQTSSEKTPTSGGSAIKDPDGTYKYFSDASITKPPQKDAVFGNGQTISIEYDGSKSREGDSVFYQLFYVDKEGSVRPVTGGPFDGTTKGAFTTDSKVFTSEADGRPGFMEVSIVQNVKVGGGEQGITGTRVKLGVYPIKFDVSK